MTPEEKLKTARKTSAFSGLILLGLSLIKVGTGYGTGSSALVADGLHSGVDIIALMSCWFGLYLSSKSPTRHFPFGFYKAETLAALFGSVVIIILGGNLLY